jgi:hypothetical protein
LRCSELAHRWQMAAACDGQYSSDMRSACWLHVAGWLAHSFSAHIVDRLSVW